METGSGRTAEATIVVIENRFYIDGIAYRLINEGAEMGHDFTIDDMLREAALCMIEHAPIMRLPDLIDDLVAAGSARFAPGPARPEYTARTVYHQIGGSSATPPCLQLALTLPSI